MDLYRLCISLLFAVVLGARTEVARAQCSGSWLSGPSAIGTDKQVFASTLWDPDGDGPMPSRLVVGGEFTTCGASSSPGVAMWDGERWVSLGSGIPGRVNAIASYQGYLYAAGEFLQAGGQAARNIARWNGVHWEPLGTGIDGPVSTMLVHKGQLFIGGSFYRGDGVPSGCLIAWDGASWIGMGSHFTTIHAPQASVYALCEFGGDLIAAGNFTKAGTKTLRLIGRWDGTAWHTLGPGPNDGNGNYVGALGVHAGLLYVGGRFTSSGGPLQTSLATWNGTSWSGTSAGLPHPLASIEAIATFGGELIVSGNFSTIGGVATANIAKYNGSTWASLGSGLTGSYVSVLQVAGANLFVGGKFENSASKVLSNACYWTGSGWEWIEPTFDAPVLAMIEYEGGYLMGGPFINTPGGRSPALVRWNGVSWQPFESDFAIGSSIDDMVMHEGSLHIAGTFSALKAGGGVVHNLAKWNGAGWLPVGNEFNGRVTGFGTYQGQMVVIGEFTACGGQPMMGIARWDGLAWQGLGSGLEDGIVWDVEEFNGELYAAGDFYIAGGQNIAALARWDGSSWRTVGSSLNAGARALLIHNDKLLIGGSFYNTGRAHLCSWDGTSISGVFGSSSVNGSVESLVQYGADVIFGGSFTKYDGQNMSGIGRLSGVTVSQVSGGMKPTTSGAVSVLSLLHSQGEIFVSGEFLGSSSTVSYNFARWSPTGLPWFVEDPRSMAACGGPIVLGAEVAGDYRGVSYQWRHNGQIVQDIPGRINGAASRQLVIANPVAADAGLYVCVGLNACGESKSEPATVTVCRADFDCTGFVDTDDFDAYVRAFEAGTENADVDGSGFVDTDDFDTFVRAFEAGC